MYDSLLQTPLKKQWKKVGTERKAGVIFPLFSIFSEQSAGIGEIPDLKPAIDWCKITGHKILQTLPLNDTGFLPSPFSPLSSVALNPIHLSLSRLKSKKIKEKELNVFRDAFPISDNYPVNYGLGNEKIKFLESIFKQSFGNDSRFKRFIEKNKYWINSYSLFKALKNNHENKPWKEWPKRYREKDAKAIESFRLEKRKEILFWQWIQWELYEQLKEVKEYAAKKEILLKGDLPLLVSIDSVDCWFNPEYFKTNLESGAPPDYFSKEGQSWGMYPYNWNAVLKDDFNYFKQRLKYAEDFYGLFRIDHVIGLFRSWSISKNKKFFDPESEKEQTERGETILRLIIQNTRMLPCAEDLGTVPDFCRKTLGELGILGLDVARNQKNFRELAVSTLSTHDLNLYPAWLGNKKIKVDQKNITRNLKSISCSPCIFNILLIFEWLFLEEKVISAKKAGDYRINNPADISRSNNWSVRMPLSMEKLINHPINKKIKKINEKGGRF